MSGRQIHLNAFDMTCAGHQSPGLWRHPDDQSHRYKELSYWTDLAVLLERGGFDSLFIADVLGVYDVYQGGADAAIRDGAQIPVNDPLLAVSAMAAVTGHLGFGITVSTTYEEPYALTRKFTTLDHLTGGRVGWNIVTSYLDSAARNLGLGRQVPHEERYARAEEFLEVCYKLWEGSWQDDAVRLDKDGGVYADPEKIHPIEHKGRYYTVPGVFLSEPSPQRTPLLFQAGSSPSGLAFAARHAEAVFFSEPRAGIVAPKVAALREQAARAGRDPATLKMFPLMTVITAATDAEAQSKYEDYRGYISYDGALVLYGGWSGIDLSGYDPGQPLRYVETEAVRSAVTGFTTADPDREWTPREVAAFIGIGGRGPVVVGGPQTVADEMERWVAEADVDGFNLAYAITPGTFEDLVTYVVPELRERGLLRTRYEGATLRENFNGAGRPRLPGSHPGAGYRRLARG